MPIVRGIVVGLVSAAMVLAVAASHAAQPTVALQASASPRLPTVSEAQTLRHSDGVVWGRVAYCTCLTGSATTNVSNALRDANLIVSLKELSPSDGWLYFAVSFDHESATSDRVGAAIEAGGGEILEGPP